VSNGGRAAEGLGIFGRSWSRAVRRYRRSWAGVCGLTVATAAILSLVAACKAPAEPSLTIDTRNPAFEQAPAAGSAVIKKEVIDVVADRTVYATNSSDSCSPGWDTAERGGSDYQWRCTLGYAQVIGAVAVTRHPTSGLDVPADARAVHGVILCRRPITPQMIVLNGELSLERPAG
jgi:hypothetical protein